MLETFPKVYDGKFAEIYDLSSELPHTGYAIWKGSFISSNGEFKEEMYDTCSFVKKLNMKVLISDCSKLRIISDSAVKWLHENWYQDASKYGLLLELIIDSTSVVGKLSLEMILDDAQTGKITTKNVKDAEDAKRVTKLFLKQKGF